MAFDRKKIESELDSENMELFEKGVKILENVDLLSDKTSALLYQERGKYAVEIAKALIRLNEKNILEKNLQLLTDTRNHALGMILLIYQLEQVKLFTEQNKIIIQQNAQHAGYISNSLSQLIESNLINEKDIITSQINFSRLMDNVQPSEDISFVLDILADAGLVTQTNFNRLIDNLNFIEDIASVFEVLNQAEPDKLVTQKNFNLLFDNIRFISCIESALQELLEPRLITQENFEYLFSSGGKNAVSLAKSFLNLHKSRIFTTDKKEDLIHSKNFPEMTAVISTMSKISILTDISHQQLTSYAKYPNYFNNINLMLSLLYDEQVRVRSVLCKEMNPLESQMPKVNLITGTEDLSMARKNFETLTRYIACSQELFDFLFEHSHKDKKPVLTQQTFDKAIKKIEMKQMESRKVFVSASNERIGKDSIIGNTFFKNKIFDKNTVHIVFDFLDYKPKLNKNG